MDVGSAHTRIDQARKIEDLHKDCKLWKSSLRFMDDEITFINKLLDSYVFEPNTPNLFERLQDYTHRLEQTQVLSIKVKERIMRHEKDLGGMLECKDDACDLGFYQKHDSIKADVNQYLGDFQILKSEIFNYAGGILKRRKA